MWKAINTILKKSSPFVFALREFGSLRLSGEHIYKPLSHREGILLPLPSHIQHGTIYRVPNPALFGYIGIWRHEDAIPAYLVYECGSLRE